MFEMRHSVLRYSGEVSLLGFFICCLISAAELVLHSYKILAIHQG